MTLESTWTTNLTSGICYRPRLSSIHELAVLIHKSAFPRFAFLIAVAVSRRRVQAVSMPRPADQESSLTVAYSSANHKPNKA
ncbi:MAG: hypothetical protein LLG20_22845 [Acidobacteriales bacterium]|nr:hypothetical protein [Terriglobales bacterium]